MRIKNTNNSIEINKSSRNDIIKNDIERKLKNKKKEITDEYQYTSKENDTDKIAKRFKNNSLLISKENKLFDVNKPNIKYKIKEKNKFLNELKFNENFNKENFEFMKIGNSFNVIGRGAYSEVLLAKNLIDQKLYAIKKVTKKLN
mgnify:CR=1 FL=1